MTNEKGFEASIEHGEAILAEMKEMRPKDNILTWMLKYQVQIESTFVPFSQSRHAKTPLKDLGGLPNLNWKVRVIQTHPKAKGFNIDGQSILETDYSAGSGHCPAYKASVKDLGGRDCILRAEVIAWECEHGFPGFNSGSLGTMRKSKQPILPDACDVLYSLSMDSDVLDAGGFEEWAENFGYDIDSRKAEKIYRACLEIALKLRNGLGEQAMAELKEACQDY